MLHDFWGNSRKKWTFNFEIIYELGIFHGHVGFQKGYMMLSDFLDIDVWVGMDWEQLHLLYTCTLWVLLNGEASPKIINAAIPSTPTQQYDFLPTTMVCQALSCHQCLSSASLFQLFAVPPRNHGGCRG